MLICSKIDLKYSILIGLEPGGYTANQSHAELNSGIWLKSKL